MMAVATIAFLILVTALINVGNSQDAFEDSPICHWSQFRVAVVRDALYIDGGQRYKIFTTSNGPEQYSSPGNGSMYSINFTMPFNVTDNLPNFLIPITEDASPSHVLDYYSGFMFADDYGVYVYGGLPNSEVVSYPPANYLYGYEFYTNTTDLSAPAVGPLPSDLTLPEDITRYITDGAGVSVPSEQLGFYFGGMTTTHSLYPNGFDLILSPVLSRTLITVDLSIPGSPTWLNQSLPEEVAPRADAQFLWLPVSRQGILVALGGVPYPETLFSSALDSDQAYDNTVMGSSFMTNIPVLDIASQTWYVQKTTGTEKPSGLSAFCAVVATDYSSNNTTHNIYIYGGYDGIVGQGTPQKPNDDVWVLSIPSFTWTMVAEGNSGNGRYFHSCVNPYPNQMWVVGGTFWEQTCLTGTFIRIFNLNTLMWDNAYDPMVWSQYQMPHQVSHSLQAAENAGFTQGGIAKDMDPDLVAIFKTPYEKHITVYYPYTVSDIEKLENAIKETLASWFGGILGIILYLLVSTTCVTIIVLVRRRMLMQRNSATTLVSSEARYSRLVRWMNNMRDESEENQALMNSRSDRPSTQRKKMVTRVFELLKDIFSMTKRFHRREQKILLNRGEKLSASDEVYELRLQQLDRDGHTAVPADQESDMPPIGSVALSERNLR